MRKGLICVVLLLLFNFVIQNIIFAQQLPVATSRYQELKELVEKIKRKINEACDELEKGSRVDIGGISILVTDWGMQGWSREVWVKEGYALEELKTAPGASGPSYYYDYYPTQKLCNEKAIIFNYLDRQVNLFPIFEDWGIFSWYTNNSLKSRANQIESFRNLMVNGLLVVNLRGRLDNPSTFRKDSVISINLDNYFHDIVLGALSQYGFMQTGGISGSYPIFYSVNSPSLCLEITEAETTKSWVPWSEETSRIVLKFTNETKELINNINPSLSQLIQSFNSAFNVGQNSASALWQSMNGLTIEGRKNVEIAEKSLFSNHKDLMEKSGNLRILMRNLLMVILSKNSNCTSGATKSQINSILNKIQDTASSTNKFVENAYIPAINRVRLQITFPTITVTTTELPIAVIPPIIFDQEHKGTTSFAQITPERIFDEIRRFLFNLAPILFILLIVVGAIFYLLAPVNLQNIRTGSEYIKWAVVGYFVLLVITGLITAVKTIFGGP